MFWGVKCEVLSSWKKLLQTDIQTSAINYPELLEAICVHASVQHKGVHRSPESQGNYDWQVCAETCLDPSTRKGFITLSSTRQYFWKENEEQLLHLKTANRFMYLFIFRKAGGNYWSWNLARSLVLTFLLLQKEVTRTLNLQLVWKTWSVLDKHLPEV